MSSRALALALGCLLQSASGFSELRFRIPEGFRDLSPGSPEASFEGVPEPVVAEAKSGKFAAFAIDLREEDGFYENFNVVVQAGALRVDDDFAREHVESVPREMASAVGAPVTVVESGITRIHGVAVLRVVMDVSYPQFTMRQLQYVVPGGRQFAVLTYAATPDTFARYLPLFEASVNATEGADTIGVNYWRAARSGLIAAGIAFVLGLIHQIAKKKRGGGGAKPPMRRMPPRPVPRRR